jgi:hypothetical protein
MTTETDVFAAYGQAMYMAAYLENELANAALELDFLTGVKSDFEKGEKL